MLIPAVSGLDFVVLDPKSVELIRSAARERRNTNAARLNSRHNRIQVATECGEFNLSSESCLFPLFQKFAGICLENRRQGVVARTGQDQDRRTFGGDGFLFCKRLL